MSQALADAVLRPRSVAIVGASADLAKNNSRPQRYLAKHGYPGTITPVNPGHAELFGLPCAPSLDAAPHSVDHAYIMVPSAAVERIVDECVAAGVRCASIFSGGFAEAGGDGAARQAALVDRARAGGLRLLGPNSLGVVNTHLPMALSANAVLERERLACGSIGLVSQSGSLIGALVSRGEARHIHFSTLVSVGNEADLSVGEIASMLVEDPATDVIALFLETLRDAAALEAAAAAAHAAGKPVLAYLLGRSAVGSALAQSHTGALAGAGRALAAFLDEIGIARVETFDGLLEAPALFRGRAPAPGRHVAVVTTTGGGGALVADQLGLRGLELAPAPASLRRELAALGVELGASPVIDLTMAGARAEVVDACLEALVAAPDVDAVAMVVGSSAEFKPELAVAPLAGRAGSAKPLAAFLFPHADASLKRLAEAGIAGFRTPEACADAIAACLAWRPPRRLPSVAAAPEIDARRPRLDEAEALTLLAELGIPTVASRRLGRDDPLPDDLTYPAVLKVLTPELAHKSDVGGVIAGLDSADAVVSARVAMRDRIAEARPDLEVDAFLVQPMERGLGEVLVGFRRDPLAGPIVVLGAGGLLAEVQEDVAIRRAPVDHTTARAMIEAVPALALLRGARGQTPGDLDALADAIVALSRLASAPAVVDAEINPLLVKDIGVIAVDAVARLEAPAP